MTDDKRFLKLPYRLCVGVMLLNRNNEVFVGKRRGESGPDQGAASYVWQMPQGGIDAGEDPLPAAIRELYEETSVQSVELLAEAPEWYSYDLPQEILRRSWRGRFRGQKQKWFAMRFTGAETEINVRRPAGGHKAEFIDWRWTPMNTLPELIIPFKRPVYEQVVAAFADLPQA